MKNVMLWAGAGQIGTAIARRMGTGMKIVVGDRKIENAQAAMRAAGVEPRIVAIRGGTDGARLSWEGLPCPNLSTGGLNFHSIHEYIPVESLQKMTRVLVALARA